MNIIFNKIFFLFFSFCFYSCCNPGSEPNPPYGNADDVSVYDGSDGYKSITYIYYCKNKKYISASYIRKDKCSDYVKESEYTSNGICGYNKFIEELHNQSPQSQLRTLFNQGYKIDTVYNRIFRSSGITEP